MRRIYTYMAAIALLAGTLNLHADDNISYLDKIAVGKPAVQKNQRQVELSMDIDLSQMKLRTQHTVALYPVLVSADGSREAEFPPVVIDGRTRSKVYLRAQQFESVSLPPFHDDNAKTILRRKNGSEQVVAYSATMPYERWMLDGRVELREKVHGCVNCQKGESAMTFLQDIIPTFHPDYKVSVIEPQPEPVKVRAENRTARIQFRQDSYIIDPKFKHNQAELDTVYNSIDLVKQNRDVTITGVYICGYASPEGSVPHNIKLTENRARALSKYIETHNRIDESLLHIDWKGEDWEGFRKEIEHFNLLQRRDEVISIIDECTGDRDACENQIKALEPKEIYEVLLNELYPILRRNEYRIEYNVRNFNLEEARREILVRPHLLSLKEMYMVAGSYEKNSPEYNRTMEIAAKQYPNEPAVVNDRAQDLMEQGDHEGAVKLLSASPLTVQYPVLQNTLGVANSRVGNIQQAAENFKKAADGGLPEAKHNLEHIEKVIDQL